MQGRISPNAPPTLPYCFALGRGTIPSPIRGWRPSSVALDCSYSRGFLENPRIPKRPPPSTLLFCSGEGDHPVHWGVETLVSGSGLQLFPGISWAARIPKRPPPTTLLFCFGEGDHPVPWGVETLVSGSGLQLFPGISLGAENSQTPLPPLPYCFALGRGTTLSFGGGDPRHIIIINIIPSYHIIL